MNETHSTELIWKLFSTKLRGFILSRVPSEDIADDLLQELFVRIHQNIGAVRDEQRLSSWVFQIARNLIADHYRSEAKRENATHEPSVEERRQANLNDEVSEWLPLAIDSLPQNYREAVRLYELEGVSQQEIADRLDLSLSGAKSRIQRGRAKLKETLHACCAFELDARGNILDYSRNTDESCRECCGDADTDCGD